MAANVHYELVLVQTGQVDSKLTICNTFQASYDVNPVPIREFGTEEEANLYLKLASKSIGALLRLRNLSAMADRRTLIHSGGSLVVRKITTEEVDQSVFQIPSLEHPDYIGDIE